MVVDSKTRDAVSGGHLGGTGIWEIALRFGDPAMTAEYAAEIEELGYSAVWIPDGGGDLFGSMAALLSQTSRISVASGILNMWMQDPSESAARFHRLQDEHGPRVLVGIGVSHGPVIKNYNRPLARMAEFLDALDAAPQPLPPSARVLAALGPKMLKLARDRSRGAHPYLVTPEHTASARDTLGQGPMLAPEQGVVLETDRARAREIARKNLNMYFSMPNYVNNWRRSGFDESDVTPPGSDRLVDALVVWGDEQTIADRLQAHRDAGADHVCIQAMIDRDDITVSPIDEWRRLAPALT
jgi:probable F420-dependent oxidoreductase